MFSPPWYLRSGHIQTVLAAVYRPKPSLANTIRYSIPLPRDVGSTYIYENGAETSSKSGILLLHGLGSSHAGTYMCNVAAKLVARGERVIRVDLPGCGPSASLTWLPGHAGCSEEIWAVLAWCHRHLQIENWRAIGFSLGGNVLLRLLATHAEDLANRQVPWNFQRALAVAPPIDLAACCDAMEGAINRWYAKYFVRILMAEVKRRAEIWPQWAEIKSLPIPRTIREFDDRFTAPLAGFNDAEDYYRQSSSGPILSAIKTPTTILFDRHDPIVPKRLFDGIVPNQFVRCVWTERGGHLGYLHRAPDGCYVRWADDWVTDHVMEEDPS